MLGRADESGRFRCQAGALNHRLGQDEYLKVAKAVANRAEHIAEGIADLRGRHGTGQQAVVELDALRIQGMRRQIQPAPRVERLPGTLIGEDDNFAKAVGRTNGDRILHLHQHSLQRLVKVNAVLGWVENCEAIVVDHPCRRLAAGRANDHRSRDGVAG